MRKDRPRATSWGDYEVAVVGAGPAGSCTALRLGERGVGRVLLAEASRFEPPRIGESVPPDTRALLAELGLLEAFLAQNHERCLGSASSWGSDELGYNDFLLNPYGTGWHLERARFDAFLAAAAAERGARLELGWRLSAARPREGGGHHLRFETAAGEVGEASAAVVVDATGQRSRFARLAGARRQVTDRLVTVAGRFALAAGGRVGKLTLLEAQSYGWWYVARLPGERAIIAVTTEPGICRRRRLREARSWLVHLARTRHLGARLDGGALASASLAAWPAPSFRLDPIHGRDWLAVGDAACAYDPLASQGIYKAIANGIQAGDAIAALLGGEGESLAVYASRLTAEYEAYLRLRAYLYDREVRWPQEPFWQARQGLAGTRAGASPAPPQ